MGGLEVDSDSGVLMLSCAVFSSYWRVLVENVLSN